MENALEDLQELYAMHDHVFTMDKNEKQKTLKHLVSKIVAQLPKVLPRDRLEKAQMYYIRGKALNVLSSYDENAKEDLIRAVKLDPHCSDGWVALGNCFWKNAQLVKAKNCFTSSLLYQRDRKALRALSMVLRQLGNTPQDKFTNIQVSVQYAKDAIKLDVQDGESWYVLGNAYLALFFCNTHSPSDLDRAFAAYKRAEACGAHNNPDLYYNRANVCRYKEDYAGAIASYQKAHALDPSLPAQEGIDVVTRWVARVSELIKKKGRVKAKRLESLVESLPSREIVQNRMPVTIANLNVGPNEGKVVALKALVDVVRSNEPPGCSVMMDEEYTCIAVSIYHLDIGLYSKMTESDVFYFLDPYLKIIELPNGKEYRYECLQVAEPHLFLVNGKVMAESYAHAQVKLDNFD